MVRIYLKIGNIFTVRSRGTDFKIEVTLDPMESNWEACVFNDDFYSVDAIERMAEVKLEARFPNRTSAAGCIPSRLAN